MKKKLFLVLGLSLLLISTCAAKRKKIAGIDRLPPLNETFGILDSIVEEGCRLYYSERINWVGSDLVMEKHQPSEIGGSVSWQPNDSTWALVFFDRDKKNCIFEYRINTNNSNDQIIVDSVRPANEAELSQWEFKMDLIRKAVKQYGSQMYFAEESFGSYNMDVVRINDNLTRVYFLQGTIHAGYIPFGNDYSIDFDANRNPIAFHRYHQGLIATPTTYEGEPVRSIKHSHLPDNPFITPTDICNFLLYRPREMDSFSVYSTAYKCTFTYSAIINKIITTVH